MKECLSAATECQNDWYNNCYLETGFYQRGLGMSTGLFFRGFCGFALQLVPSTLFMLLPFRKECFSIGKRRAFLLFAAVSIFLSMVYPLNVWLNKYSEKTGNLDDNLYMLLSIVIVAVLFFLITREKTVRKLFVLFIVINYAAIQFFLSNMLMDILPLQKQNMVYNDATIAAYLIVTALLLPPFALFLYRTVKDYLQSLTSDGIMPEFLFLAVIFALYLVLNALYSAFWVSLRDEYHLASAYYIPYSLFLSLLLMFTLYSIFSLSVSKENNRKHELELALMRQNYNHIDEKMQQQRRSLHDTRQLLRNLSTLAKEGSKEELLKYIDDTMKTTVVSEIQFCANPCINGLLQYYAHASETQGIVFSVQAACGSLPFTDTDLTILLGNALDNAIRAAEESKGVVPDSQPEIRFTAGPVKDQFAFQIENTCLSVSWSETFPREQYVDRDSFLPASAFMSTHGGGYGLKRMEMICRKYGGYAWFSYDPAGKCFTTRLMLPLMEE